MPVYADHNEQFREDEYRKQGCHYDLRQQPLRDEEEREADRDGRSA
jgi:hypothetical protein